MTGAVRGRPRAEGVDEAILSAARDLLAEVGYDAFRFEEVARRASVTRPTIYLRWPSKLHLAYDAAFPGSEGFQFETCHDFRADVERLVIETIQTYSRPATRAATLAILTAFQHQPELAEELREPSASKARQRFLDAVTAAVARGEARAGTDPEMLFETIVGAVQFRVVIHGRLGDRFASDLVSLIVEGAAADPNAPTRRSTRGQRSTGNVRRRVVPRSGGGE